MPPASVIEDFAAEDEFAGCEYSKQKLQDCNAQRELLYCGTAFQTYTQNLNTNSTCGVTICDNGTHQCTSKCHLAEIKFSVYKLPFAKSRVHVCTHGLPCSAPPAFHKHCMGVHARKLFVCLSSNKCHICTPELCDAARVTVDAYTCCSLTGNVVCTDPGQLSTGWTEDNWRTGSTQHTYTDKAEDWLPYQEQHEDVAIVDGDHGFADAVVTANSTIVQRKRCRRQKVNRKKNTATQISKRAKVDIENATLREICRLMTQQDTGAEDRCKLENCFSC